VASVVAQTHSTPLSAPSGVRSPEFTRRYFISPSEFGFLRLPSAQAFLAAVADSDPTDAKARKVPNTNKFILMMRATVNSAGRMAAASLYGRARGANHAAGNYSFAVALRRRWRLLRSFAMGHGWWLGYIWHRHCHCAHIVFPRRH
jgi:hypothetical protein